MIKSETNKKIQREFTGEVVSMGGQKTVVVRLDSLRQHSKYKKSYRVSRKYWVHDEKGIAKVGDKVKFVECRPLSKTKRWRLVK